jgi:hypothetical protein
MSRPSAPLDPLVAHALDQQTHAQSEIQDHDTDSDTDSLLGSLADDPHIAAHRAARAQQLSSLLAAQRSVVREEGHGTVTSVNGEKELMDLVTKGSSGSTFGSRSSEPAFASSTFSGGEGAAGEERGARRTLCHFHHPSFPLCATMDELLAKLAPRHLEVRFLRVRADDAEWLCRRMGVRVLPCVVGWVGGMESGRVVGFEGVRGVGLDGVKGGVEVAVKGLERCLVEKGVLVREKGDFAGRRDDGDEEMEEKENEDDDWD